MQGWGPVIIFPGYCYNTASTMQLSNRRNQESEISTVMNVTGFDRAPYYDALLRGCLNNIQPLGLSAVIMRRGLFLLCNC